MTQIRFLDLVDIDAVVTDLTILNIVETVDQVRDRCLSGSGRSDKGDLLTRSRIQIHIVQNNLIRHISKVHIVEDDISGQTLVIYRTVCLMYMLPCPDTGRLIGLCELSVFFLRIHESDITFVGLRFFIEKLEDTLTTCHRHNHTVELHADL